jgi:hypothetical protein
MKNCIDTFPEVPRIGDGRRNERRVIGPFGFYDCSMIQIGSRAKVFEIFRGVRARPDPFKTTLRKFEFFQKRREPRAWRFCAKNLGLEWCMFVEKLRQSRVIAINKIRKSRRRMSNETRRKNVTTEFRCIDRCDSTSEAVGYRSARRRSDVERTNDWKMVCRRNR